MKMKFLAIFIFTKRKRAEMFGLLVYFFLFPSIFFRHFLCCLQTSPHFSTFFLLTFCLSSFRDVRMKFSRKLFWRGCFSHIIRYVHLTFARKRKIDNIEWLRRKENVWCVWGCSTDFERQRNGATCWRKWMNIRIERKNEWIEMATLTEEDHQESDGREKCD